MLQFTGEIHGQTVTLQTAQCVLPQYIIDPLSVYFRKNQLQWNSQQGRPLCPICKGIVFIYLPSIYIPYIYNTNVYLPRYIKDVTQILNGRLKDGVGPQ